jgi:hypothetical protein
MKGFHSFFKRGSFVIAMDLQQVDVVGVETLEGCFNLIEDCGSRETILVLVIF